MNLTEFVSGLPADWATAPIFRAGVVMPNGEKSSGKVPLGRAHKEDLSPKFSAKTLQEQPDTFGAVGVFAKRSGIVIWDCDTNLGQLTQKYGDDLHGPHVLSEKPNAGKWLFYVPEEWHDRITDLYHSDTKEGWEALWQRQGVVAGAYKDLGVYTPSGDFGLLPEAPRWLLEAMEAKQHEKDKPRIAKSREEEYLGRTRSEKEVIVRACLSVIRHRQGEADVGHERVWWRVGAAIHHTFDGDDLGLTLFRDWSREDPFYAAEWEAGEDPCADKWHNSYDSTKGNAVRMGTLIDYADDADPERTRYKKFRCEALIQEIESPINRIKQTYLSYEEAMKLGDKLMQVEDTAEMNYEQSLLALAAGFRDRAALEHVLIERMAPEATGVINLAEIETPEMDYLIPDVVPHPAHILVYGSGGDGKSSACWRLIKHILYGESFLVRGEHVPVKKGKVLIFNGDQPLHLLKSQLRDAEIDFKDVGVINNWNLQSYAKFKRIMDEHKPDLVVFDSLIGCSGACFDENKSDFATPLYWLTRNNGAAFPATTMVTIHHANKQGEFRGTSAIRDAVDETWSLKKPSKELVERGELQPHNRIISIEKSRSGRSGTALIMKQETDLTFSLSDFTPAIDKQNTAPSAVIDLVLHRLRASYPRELSKKDLVADQLVGGNKAAITKSLQRLVQRGLISCDSKRGRELLYKAVLARGEGLKSVFFKKKPVVDKEVVVDRGVQKDPVVHLRSETDPGASESGQVDTENEGCPPPDASAGAESPQNGQLGTSIRAGAREEDWDDPELLSKLR